jgi:uncharacterized protein
MESQPTFDLIAILAQESSLPADRVKAVVALLDEGATVPFIARYRKEVSGGMDEVQIRDLEEKRLYFRELEDRRQSIVASINEQGKLTPELAAKINACRNKQVLEDLYLPYKPKRRNKATTAKEQGLEPLALWIAAQPLEGHLQVEAEKYLDAEKGVAAIQDAINGARDILVENISDHAEVRTLMRQVYLEQGEISTSVVPEKAQERTKFEDYYEYRESAKAMPSHRFLAIRRGETEGILRSALEIENASVLAQIEKMVGVNPDSPLAVEYKKAIGEAFKRRLTIGVETDVRLELKQRADRQAVEIFAGNLENLLLAAPLGGYAVIGIDPGLRTGCKCAAVDATGRYLESMTMYPLRGAGDKDRAADDLAAFIVKHKPRALAIGNGTGGRETEAFAREVIKTRKLGADEPILVVPVSEAGASIYSASEVAREEFPDLDLTIRGAISIARRLQDPLAELVKLDPKSIGVGQYQHDVQQTLLQRKLHEIVESCVNRVGVELNTASASLLSYVAGLGPSLAKRIVEHRNSKGPFADRSGVRSVSGVGPKAFEQSAGFLRVATSANPLDNSAVHPERYSLCEQIALDLGRPLKEIVGRADAFTALDFKRYLAAGVGEPTLRDILEELKKPGRDPREAFEPPRFRDDVNSLEDLVVGMTLEGIVTNVTAFGAFVDIGVHQDGLVHISELADRFIKDASEVVKVGDRLQVRVLEVDLVRKRIALSARKEGARARPETQNPRGDASGSPRPSTGHVGGSRGAQDSGHARQGRRPDDRAASSPRAPNSDRGGFANNPFAAKLGKR